MPIRQGREATVPGLVCSRSLKDVEPEERRELFRKHLHLCKVRFDFRRANRQEKEAKRLLLLGLVDYVDTIPGAFEVSLYSEVLSFVSANLFREFASLTPLLPAPTNAENGLTSGGVTLDDAWPHLQVVYEFLLRFVVSPDVEAKVARRYISRGFVTRLLALFNSPDPRERDYLKTITHRIYGKFLALRSFIRYSINDAYFRVIHEGQAHRGIGELLEIQGSVISGFALPLKEEHQRFLRRALLPLHKAEGVVDFHQQLAFCVVQFVEKDPETALPIMLGILRVWPRACSQRQVLFFNELEDVIDLTRPAEFRLAVPLLFRQVAQSLSSPHFQVAERALYLWNNEYFVSLVAQNRFDVLPLIIGSLRQSRDHWNPTVSKLVENVEKLFVDMDSALYANTLAEWERNVHAAREQREAREVQWETLLNSVPSKC